MAASSCEVMGGGTGATGILIWGGIDGVHTGFKSVDGL